MMDKIRILINFGGETEKHATSYQYISHYLYHCFLTSSRLFVERGRDYQHQ